MNKPLSLLALLALACQEPSLDPEITTTTEELTASGVLFVVGATPVDTKSPDAPMKALLEGLAVGAVTVKSGSAVTSADASGRRVVVVSSTVTSGDVKAKFKTVTVPVVTYESAILDDMGMTKTTSTEYGTAPSQTTLTMMVAKSDPMAADLSGTPTVVTKADTFSWGRPASAAVKVARLSGDTSKFPIFRYEKGAQMVGLTAPERRVALFLGDASGSLLTIKGRNLAEAALRWAARLPVKKGLGSACAATADCATGACVEGICCSSTCTGTCMSCNLPGKEGTCTPVPSGQDPKSQCPTSAAMTCGTDGFCDGAGKCRLYAMGTQCAPGTCSGSTEYAASICDGQGICKSGPSKSCGDYMCSGVACGVSCTSDSQCAPGSHCWQGQCNHPCTFPRPDNLLTTGGFDSFDELYKTWKSIADDRAGMGWGVDDFDDCPGSGSMYLYTDVSNVRATRCVPAKGDVDYYFGGKIKGTIVTDWQPSCGVSFHASTDCSGAVLASNRVQLASLVPGPQQWVSFAAGYRSPMPTQSILFDCDVLDDIGTTQFTYFDQLFLTPNIPAF